MTQERPGFRRVVVATHYYATGPAFDLETYLIPRLESLLFIAHPLFAGQGPAYFRRYQLGKLVGKGERPAAPGSLRFGEDVTRTVRWCRGAGPIDLFIAGDNLLALAGLWLRRRRKARAVVLYTIDYVPNRFSNPALNRLYHRIDRHAASHADCVWNVSRAIEEARRKRDGNARVAPQLVVPLGANFDRIARVPLKDAQPHRIAFLGHLLEKQGLQLVLEAMPAIRSQIPDATLLVLGDGPYAPELRALAARLHLDDAVAFAGFIDDHEEVERRLAHCGVAVAPYVPDPGSFTRFADPGKIKTYLACGLPVVLTDVPPIAPEVEAAGAGRVVPYAVQPMADAIIGLLRDQVALERARQAATAFGARFAWGRIFDEALAGTARVIR